MQKVLYPGHLVWTYCVSSCLLSANKCVRYQIEENILIHATCKAARFPFSLYAWPKVATLDSQTALCGQRLQNPELLLSHRASEYLSSNKIFAVFTTCWEFMINQFYRVDFSVIWTIDRLHYRSSLRLLHMEPGNSSHHPVALLSSTSCPVSCIPRIGYICVLIQLQKWFALALKV